MRLFKTQISIREAGERAMC